MTPKKIINKLIERIFFDLDQRQSRRYPNPGQFYKELTSEEEKEIIKNLSEKDVSDLRDDQIKMWAEHSEWLRTNLKRRI